MSGRAGRERAGAGAVGAAGAGERRRRRLPPREPGRLRAGPGEAGVPALHRRSRRRAVRAGRGRQRGGFSGTIGADRGPWNDRYAAVNQIDFDAFADPGVYVLEAAGATSPPFRVGTGSDLYTPLLHNALFYFLAQRDGADVDPTVLQREPSHLNDRHAKVYETPEYHNGFLVHDLVPTGDRVDTEGGWFDAGDYVKFAHTTAFVLAVMGEALRDHPELFTGDGPDFASEARFGLDWLLRQWDGTRKVLYYQVSMGNTGLGYLSDHDVWRLPEVDDALKGRAYRYLSHRPVFRVGPPGTLVPPSIAGRMAAAFGLCFQVFQDSNAGPGRPLPPRGGGRVRHREDPAHDEPHHGAERLLPGGTDVARRPGARRDRAAPGAPRRRDAPRRPAAHRPGVLPGVGGGVGRRVHAAVRRPARRVQPLRRRGARAPRAVRGHHRGRRPAARGHGR